MHFINFIYVHVTQAHPARRVTQPLTVYMAKSDPARRVTRQGRPDAALHNGDSLDV